MEEKYGGGVYEEENFEFPLFKLVREKAEELDISYHDALVLVKPDYVRTCRYGDEKFEQQAIDEFEIISQKTNANWEAFMKEREGK